MVLIGPARSRARLFCGLLVLLGLGLALSGAGISRGGGIDRPTPFWPGLEVAVPDPGPFGGRVALYGAATASSPGTEPPDCRADTPDGDTARVWSGPGHTTGPDALERRVVDGIALVPLVEIEPVAGARLRCTDAGGRAPLYLITSGGVRDMAPMAVYSLATLALVLGGAGVLMLRREAA